MFNGSGLDIASDISTISTHLEVPGVERSVHLRGILTVQVPVACSLTFLRSTAGRLPPGCIPILASVDSPQWSSHCPGKRLRGKRMQRTTRLNLGWSRSTHRSSQSDLPAIHLQCGNCIIISCNQPSICRFSELYGNWVSKDCASATVMRLGRVRLMQQLG